MQSRKQNHLLVRWDKMYQLVLVSTTAWSLGGWLGSAIGGDNDWLIGMLIACSMTWILQSMIIRQFISPPTMRWPTISCLGFIAGFGIFTYLSWYTEQLLFNIQLSHLEDIVVFSTVFTSIGGMVSLVQFFLLRSHVQYAWLWVPSNMISWFFGGSLLITVSWLLPLNMALLAGFTAMGIVQGLANAITLSVLMAS